MTSSQSSSSRVTALAAAAFLLGSCAHREVAPLEAPRARLALLPPENLTGGAVALKGFAASLERALASAGVEVVAGEAVEQYLHRHRIRYTAGLDGPSAQAAKEELGVDGLLIATVQQYVDGAPPRIAIGMRVVSAEETPHITWIDGVAMTGDDNPGFLALGIVHTLAELEAMALEALSDRLGAFLDHKGPRSVPCPAGGGSAWVHRSPQLDTSKPLSIIVLPLMNRTPRRGAGDIVAMQIARELAAVPGIEVVEPGIVRDELLAFRVVMQEGPSLDDVLAINASLRADLIVAGEVLAYDDGPSGIPKVNFSVLAIDGKTRRVVWRSNSRAQGDDGVFFFGLGSVTTASDLTCRVSRGVVDGFLAGKRPQAVAESAPAAGR